jgi:GDP-mannose transporter
MVSGTTFTLVGVVNKFLTVLLNVLLWDKHSSALGLVAVCICLLAGVFYQQAPKRSDEHKVVELTKSDYNKDIGAIESLLKK